MQAIAVSFVVGDKTVTVKRESESGVDMREVLSALLREVEEVELLDKASSGQLRALYARAFAAGWDKRKVEELLTNALGTSARDEIVGVMERSRLSRLIDEIAPVEVVPGKATAAQMRALWAKALARGWERDRVKKFLQEKVGECQDNRIIGRIEKERISSIIDEIAAA